MVVENKTVSVTLPAEIVYPVSALSEDRTLEVGNVPVESLIKLLTYGVTQYVADGAAVDVHERDDDGKHVEVNGAKVKRPESDVAKDKVKGVHERLASILSGIFKTGGGGRALSAYDNELRAIVKAVLVGKGIKLADATKAAKTPTVAIQDLAAKKAKADGLNKTDAEALFNVNWEVLTNKATALAAEHKSIDVDL